MATGESAEYEVCAEVLVAMLVAVHIAVPDAAHGEVDSAAIELAGIYSAGTAVEAVQPLEMSVATHDMFAAEDTAAAADTELSTADSAAADSSTAPAAARSEATEKYAAECSAEIPSVVAETCPDMRSELVEFAATSESYCS
jgi:hypothetical protein